MTRILSFVAMICLSVAANAQPTGGDKVLDRLRGLGGTWKGTFEWSGGRTGSGELEATYSLTGNGSAVMEHLTMGGAAIPSMTSVYHMDGPDLRVTHYCAAQNQPRLRATRINEANDTVHFSFIDATNLSVQPAHVEAIMLRFVSPDRVVIEFTFSGAKKSIEHIELTRSRS